MHYVTLTDANFEQEVLKSNMPVLVDFYADWCGPCRAVAPIIEELASEYAGKVKVGKLDVDSNPAIAGAFGIRSIPTLLLFDSGRLVDQVVGAPGKPYLRERLDAVVTAA